MKLLYFTDAHIRATSPVGRKDNFYQTILSKLSEIKDYANSHNIDYVIHGGDLFDRPDTAIQPSSKAGQILMDFDMPIYTVIGNHDIYGYNRDTISRSMVGLFLSLGIIRSIPEEGIILEKAGTKVFLYGTDYSYDLDRNPDNYILEKSMIPEGIDKTVHIVHGFLMDKPFIEGVPHVLVGEIVKTKADVVLSGHYHSGYPTQYLEGKYFINPGSIVRISRSDREVKRRPKFIILDIEEDINIEEVYLQSALPGEEVLDVDKLRSDQYKNQRMIIFSESVDSNIDLEQISLDTILDQIASSENVEEKVRKEAKVRLDYAKGKLDE